MDRSQKWTTIFLVSIVLAAFAASTLAASTSLSSRNSTPLFVFRMEQASSEKHFLPSERNEYTYMAQKGYRLDYPVEACCYAVPLEEPTQGEVTCDNTCPSTCRNTCPSTCVSTCTNTCVSTCNTCVSTCCTCVSTCSTCVSTCTNTCVSTCPYTCMYSCGYTCGFTCNGC